MFETEAITSAKLVYDSLLRDGFKITHWASSSPLVGASLSDGGLPPDLNLDLHSTPIE